MRRVIAAALVISGVMLFPAALPPGESVSYVSARVPPVVIPTVLAPVRPVADALGTRVITDTVQVASRAERPVEYLTRYELKTILAETGFRSYVIRTRQIEDGSWITDDRFFLMVWALVMCESSGRVDAVGDEGASIGQFLINTEYWGQLTQKHGANLFDPVDNAEIAFQIWKISGESFRLWSCNPTEG